MDDRLPGYLQRVLAPNPGPMTLEGTNTLVVGDPRRGAPVVVDPGPLDDGHLAAVLAAAGGRVASVLLTHRHADHSAGAARLAGTAGCGVRAADPAHQLGPGGPADRAGRKGLVQGDTLSVPGAELVVLATPGHTGDSCSLLVRGEDGDRWLLTGDTVLGRGSTVLSRPDGDLGGYLSSLALLAETVATEEVREILPGHGPRVADPAGWLAACVRHRDERLTAVRSALAAGDRTAAEVVARVYADVDRSLWPAAEQSVAAQLAYLAQQRP